jgi:hypothetical protein
MNEATYAAMREFIKVAVELEVRKCVAETRSVEPRSVIEGPPGKDGRDGVDGKDGKDGDPGPRGDVGPQGDRGADGLQGRDGAPGPQGARGADGIATRAEIIALMEERYAELQVRNLADSWRGVWSPAETYQRGNVAQWDGSPWLALAEKPVTKPGTSTEWVLFAKKGRDGKK